MTRTVPCEIGADLSRKISCVGFLCAVLVVMQHVKGDFAEDTWRWWIFQLVSRDGVSMGAVPVFFALSGFLMAGKMEGGIMEIKKRLKSLVVPYVMWNLIFCILRAFRLIDVEALGGCVDGSVLDRVVRIFGLFPLEYPEHSYLWFVRCLILLVLISPVLRIMKCRWAIVISAIVWAISFKISRCFDFGDSWVPYFNFYGYMQGFMFFSAGMWLRYNPIPSPKWWIVVVPTILLFVLRHAAGSGMIRMISLAMLRPLWAAMLWTVIPASRQLENLRPFTFPLYLFHGVILLAFPVIFGTDLLRGVSHSITAYFSVVMFVVVLSVIMTQAMRKWSPGMCCILFGGR